eukprot:TRINITY_DN47228_c0_g1_i1.p1 TRINITY_DN47228_c0_g1~~TRINITY_DN47228_c0_g1_i1.p1  ORF type:complete len:100 (+),score=15.45 TRINITY_DN47228_c0_g1_i1:186-485(+)
MLLLHTGVFGEASYLLMAFNTMVISLVDVRKRQPWEAVAAVFAGIQPIQVAILDTNHTIWEAVSYTHLRAHETPEHLVCRLLLEKKNTTTTNSCYSMHN